MTNLDDASPGSLRSEILATPAGGVVVFSPGLSGTITLTSGELLIDKDLTISGPGAQVLAVSSLSTSRIFRIEVGVTVEISGLTIRDGQVTGAPGGTGLPGTGSPGPVCSQPEPGGPGGPGEPGGTAEGGGIFNAGALTLRNCQLENNLAVGGPGGAGGVGGIAGGGFALRGGVPCASPGGDGGDGGVGGSGGNGLGGGIYNAASGSLVVVGSTFVLNAANGGSGGVGGAGANGGSGADGGDGGDGGDGESGGAGGSGHGGAIYNLGTATVSNSTFSQNRSEAAMPAAGGAGGNGGNSSGGTAGDGGNGGDGGDSGTGFGAAIESETALTLDHVTFFGNFHVVPTDPGAGGQSGIGGNGSVPGSDGNSGSEGFNDPTQNGELFVARGTTSLSRSVFGGPLSTNCGGLAVTSGGYNVSDDSSCASSLTATLDANAIAPQLAALALNGPGQTETHLPTIGPAVNRVPVAACSQTLDQRGLPRPQGSGCESGSVELAESPAVPVGPWGLALLALLLAGTAWRVLGRGDPRLGI